MTRVAFPQGPINDRSTIFKNPFRNKWVASIKDNFGPSNDGLQRRARSYYETDSILRDNNWTHHGSSCPPHANCPYAWVSADTADPPNPDCGRACFVSELYNFDVIAYESVLIGLYAIFRGFSGGGSRITGELNELHIGTSRDGFHFSRPPPSQRRAFMGYSYPEHSFPNTDVQSVANGMVVSDHLITFFGMGRTGQPQYYSSDNPGGNRSMAAATIRRDGFASLETTGAGLAPSFLWTVPTVFSATQTFVFVNVKLAAGGFLQVGIAEEALSPSGDVVFLPGFEPENSAVGDIGRDSCTELPFDSTKALVTWGGHGNRSSSAYATTHDGGSSGGGRGGGVYRFAGGGAAPVRFVFHMGGASLYSFWVSTNSCGNSRGYLGASGRDVHGC